MRELKEHFVYQINKQFTGGRVLVIVFFCGLDLILVDIVTRFTPYCIENDRLSNKRGQVAVLNS